MCPAALAFIPTLHDVVALESFNGLGGSGLTRAFLRNPADGTGVLIDERGIIVAVPPEKWKVLVRAAEDAREAITGFVGGAICWSRSDDVGISSQVQPQGPDMRVLDSEHLLNRHVLRRGSAKRA
jgi:hypothetical protein